MEKRKTFIEADYVPLSRIFHENTKLFSIDIQTDTNKRNQFKSYPRFPKILLNNEFPESMLLKQFSEKSLRKEFTITPLSIDQLSEILFCSAGVIFSDKEQDGTRSQRANISVTETYPLEVYPIILHSRDVASGIYHYNIRNNILETIEEGDFTRQMIHATKDRRLTNASLAILISAIFLRTERFYGERGYRYVMFDAGHLAQNIFLVTTSMGLGCHIIVEFLDDELNRLLDLDGVQEAIIYVVTIGGKKRSLANKVRAFFQSN